MPYNYPDNVPDYIKNLPASAQQLCIGAFNKVHADTGDEEQARMACWVAVKSGYEQVGDHWIKKMGEKLMLDLSKIDTLAKAYAAHNKLHAEYVDARWGTRRKATMQEEHEALVRHIKKLGGKHLPKGEALDDTLPQELQDAVKMRYVSDSLVLVEEEGQPAHSAIQILRTGTFFHPTYGKFTISQAHLDTMFNNFNNVRPKAPTELVVDFEHMSVADPPVIAPAAGWVKGLTVTPGALWAEVEWTAEAATKIRNMEYRYISPEFHLNYTDKETNKKIGATLLAVALTNRPFLEGMAPVVLSEGLSDKALILTDAPAILCQSMAEVQCINNLPDDCFACILPGGLLGEEGQTEPMRLLLYKGADGVVNPVLLALALGSLPQMPMSNAEKDKAQALLTKAALEVSFGDTGTQNSDTGGAMELKDITKALGLSEDGDAVKAIADLKAEAAQVKTLTEQVKDLNTKLVDAEAKEATATIKLNEAAVTAAVDQAITDQKITPKLREWAVGYATRDMEGFNAYIKTVEPVGPELGEKGGVVKVDTKLTATEAKIAKKLGLSEETVEAQKAKELEAASLKE